MYPDKRLKNLAPVIPIKFAERYGMLLNGIIKKNRYRMFILSLKEIYIKRGMRHIIIPTIGFKTIKKLAKNANKTTKTVVKSVFNV